MKRRRPGERHGRAAALAPRLGQVPRTLSQETISLGERCFAWLDNRGRDKPQSKIHTDGFADDVVAPPECPSISDLPTRSRPFTYPTRNHTESNTVDLIAVEGGDQLTMTHPDNSDAKITSDIWMDVEQ